MVNIGQLARKEYGEKNVYLVGFSCYSGTVIAGREWGAPMEVMEVPRARPGSIEAVLHKENAGASYILFSEEEHGLYRTAVPHRAIGVVYDPLSEKYGNYVPSILSRRYNAFIYFEETKALHPLHLHPDRHKLPDTYPFSF